MSTITETTQVGSFGEPCRHIEFEDADGVMLAVTVAVTPPQTLCHDECEAVNRVHIGMATVGRDGIFVPTSRDQIQRLIDVLTAVRDGVMP